MAPLVKSEKIVLEHVVSPDAEAKLLPSLQVDAIKTEVYAGVGRARRTAVHKTEFVAVYAEPDLCMEKREAAYRGLDGDNLDIIVEF